MCLAVSLIWFDLPEIGNQENYHLCKIHVPVLKMLLAQVFIYGYFLFVHLNFKQVPEIICVFCEVYHLLFYEV